jgi:hypothetical protein
MTEEAGFTARSYGAGSGIRVIKIIFRTESISWVAVGILVYLGSRSKVSRN